METPTANLDRSLVEFAAVTGISIDEPEVLQKANALLARHNHNLNNAVLHYFEKGLDSAPSEGPPDIETVTDAATSASGAERYESVPAQRNLHREFQYHSLLPRFPKAPRISNNWQFEVGIHASIKEQELKERVKAPEKTTASKAFSVFWMLLLVFPKALSMLYPLVRFLLRRSSPQLFQSTTKRFDYNSYELGYNFAHDLRLVDLAGNYNIQTSGFNKCHEKSMKDYEFMIMVIVDNDSFDFIKQLLLTPEFSALFHKDTGTFKNSVLYFSNVDKDPEANEVYKNYRMRRFPFILLLGNVSNDPTVMSSMSIIYRNNFYLKDVPSWTSPLTIENLVTDLKLHMTDYNPQLVTKRHDKQDMEFSRMLKEQQDKAYLESLQHDKVKKQERQLKSQQEEKKARRVRDRMSFLHHIQKTHYFSSQVENATSSDSVRVAIKMPDGKRVVQKFLKSASMNMVYLFTESKLVAVEGDVDEVPALDTEQYFQEYSFNFELIKPMPKVVLPTTAETIEEFGSLKSGDNILVEYLDDE